jgi:hypothetical protein
MIDTDNLPGGPDDEIDTEIAADEIAAQIAGDADGEGEPDDQIDAAPDDDEGTPSQAPAAPDPAVVRQEFERATAQHLANDADLRFAARVQRDPSLLEQFAQENPQEFIQWRARTEAKIGQIQAVEAEVRLFEERAKLAKAMPDFDNPKTAKGAKAAMSTYLTEAGFTPAEIASIGDHRVLKVVSEAQRMRALHGRPKSGPRVRMNKLLEGKSLHDQADAIARLL